MHVRPRCGPLRDGRTPPAFAPRSHSDGDGDGRWDRGDLAEVGDVSARREAEIRMARNAARGTDPWLADPTHHARLEAIQRVWHPDELAGYQKPPELTVAETKGPSAESRTMQLAAQSPVHNGHN